MRLEEYGLIERQNVRFKKSRRKHWIRGHALSVNKDGSILIGTSDAKHSGLHSLVPGNVEKQGVGPRGGKIWLPISN